MNIFMTVKTCVIIVYNVDVFTIYQTLFQNIRILTVTYQN